MLPLLFILAAPAEAKERRKRLVRQHGCEAIGRAWMIPNFQQTPHLDWLLRRFKGKHYRRRYPAISFVQGEAVKAES